MSPREESQVNIMDQMKKFYPKEEFQAFVGDTPFETAEFLEEDNNYLWVLKRK